MIAGLTKGDKAVEAGKTSDQLRELSVAEYVVKSINDLQKLHDRLRSPAEYVVKSINDLQKLHDRLRSPQGNDCVDDIKKFAQDGGELGIFQLLESYINNAEKNEPSIENLTIMKFLRSIIEDRELYKKLCSFDDFLRHFDYMSNPTYYEKIHSQYCELENLRDKINLLALLRERMDFADIQKAYDNWRFSDLIGDNDFKRMYVDQAVKEREKPVNEDFEKNIGKYIELVKEGKEVASRYFEKWKVNFQAYCEKINNDRVLNINLINYDKSEPTKISDILQQEKDIKELNIYCNKKHEIYAHQKDKKRYYEFKEGAYYEMTSTWPVKDGSGICTMIMNVSSDGITEILEFNGEDFVLSEEILELIKQNGELYIQGLSLYDAVMESLEKDRAADVVPINFHNESIVAYQGKEPEGKLDHKIDADNSLPLSSINSNALIQTKVNLQHTETQPEVASQQIGTQAETNSQRMDELIPDNQMLPKENVELKQEIEAEANQTIVKLERLGRDLKDELEEERLKFNIEEPENEYEEFLEEMITLELIEDEDEDEDEDNVDELKEDYSDIIADQIQTIEEMKEEIESLNNQVKYLEDQQDQVTDKQRMNKIFSGDAKEYYTLIGDVSSEPDNESDVPLKEKTELRRSLSSDGGYGSDEENCDNDLSSHISSISSIEKVVESRNVGSSLSSCIMLR